MRAKNLRNSDCNDEITEFDLENDIPVEEKRENDRKCDVIQEENGDITEASNSSEPTEQISSSMKPSRRKRLVSTSLTKTPVIDTELVDYNNHKLTPSTDPFDLKYKLYAVVVSLIILINFLILL